MKVKIIRRDGKFYPLRIEDGKEVEIYCPFIQLNTQCGSWCPLIERRQGKMTELVIWKCSHHLQVGEIVGVGK